jgi:hypothetical protein
MQLFFISSLLYVFLFSANKERDHSPPSSFSKQSGLCFEKGEGGAGFFRRCQL